MKRMGQIFKGSYGAKGEFFSNKKLTPPLADLPSIAKRLGRKAYEAMAQIMQPDTIVGWRRQPNVRRFDSLKNQASTEASLKVEAIE